MSNYRASESCCMAINRFDRWAISEVWERLDPRLLIDYMYCSSQLIKWDFRSPHAQRWHPPANADQLNVNWTLTLWSVSIWPPLLKYVATSYHRRSQCVARSRRIHGHRSASHAVGYTRRTDLLTGSFRVRCASHPSAALAAWTAGRRRWTTPHTPHTRYSVFIDAVLLCLCCFVIQSSDVY